MQRRIFYSVIAGFVGGILIRSFADWGISFAFFLIGIGVSFFILLLLQQRLSGYLAVGLFCVAAGLGMLRFDLADEPPPASLNRFLSTPGAFEGVVIEEPDEREMRTRLVVRLILVSGDAESAGAKVLVGTAREPRYAYGDRLRLTGTLRRPENFTDENLREVDYVSFLAKEGIYFESFEPRIERIGGGEGNPVVAGLLHFKQAFVARLHELIPEPHASLLAGLVVGAKQSLGKKLLDDFRKTGIIHIVVLSGYNLTIVAMFIERIFSALRKKYRLLLSAGGIILFAIMVGASATVVRATIMALLVVLARSTGRAYDVTRALVLAGLLMLVHNPKILVFDTSFQLSFLATVGLIYISPLIEPRVVWVTERWHLREIVVATIATQIFVLPFLLYKTGLLSLVALPVNLLVLIVIPFTMFLGFLAGMVGFISGALAAPFAFASYALLSYELAVVDWFANLPFASVRFVSFPFGLIVLCYLFYAGVLFLLYRKYAPVAFSKSVLV